MVCEFEPHIGLCTDGAETHESLSLPLPHSLTLALSLSLSLSHIHSHLVITSSVFMTAIGENLESFLLVEVM